MKDGCPYVVYDCNSPDATGKVMGREIMRQHIVDYEYVGRTPWSERSVIALKTTFMWTKGKIGGADI